MFAQRNAIYILLSTYYDAGIVSANVNSSESIIYPNIVTK